jgi:hypothetical protein
VAKADKPYSMGQRAADLILPSPFAHIDGRNKAILGSSLVARLAGFLSPKVRKPR